MNKYFSEKVGLKCQSILKESTTSINCTVELLNPIKNKSQNAGI